MHLLDGYERIDIVRKRKSIYSRFKLCRFYRSYFIWSHYLYMFSSSRCVVRNFIGCFVDNNSNIKQNIH